jgi:cytochrome c oxidase subunit 1
MRRRIADYDPALHLQSDHIVMTICGFLIAISILIFIINVIITNRRGELATGNLWNSRSPEWQVPSPMPIHNYDKPFEVVGNPYDYGLPGSTYVKFIDQE